MINNIKLHIKKRLMETLPVYISGSPNIGVHKKKMKKRKMAHTYI